MEDIVITQAREAIRSGNLETVRELVETNEELLEVNTVFGTLLHDAASFGTIDITKYLIEAGIDINKKGGIRKSGALTTAAFVGRCDVVKLLYSLGAELETDRFESNPLFAAIYGDYEEIVRFLVESGIDTTVAYPIGKLDHCDAYEYARQYGRTEIAEYLKEINQ